MKTDIETIKEIIELEHKSKKKHGAHLSHWANNNAALNIDEGALHALLAYYEKQEGRKVV